MVTAVIEIAVEQVAPASERRSPPITLALAAIARAPTPAPRPVASLLALVASERAGEGVEQQIFAVLFDLVGSWS